MCYTKFFECDYVGKILDKSENVHRNYKAMRTLD